MIKVQHCTTQRMAGCDTGAIGSIPHTSNSKSVNVVIAVNAATTIAARVPINQPASTIVSGYMHTDVPLKPPKKYDTTVM